MFLGGGFVVPLCCSQVERPTGEKKKEKTHTAPLWFYFQNCSLVKVLAYPLFQLYIWGEDDAGVEGPASIGPWSSGFECTVPKEARFRGAAVRLILMPAS